jgi:hypothetical protein
MSTVNKQYNVVFQLDLEQKNAKMSVSKIKTFARDRQLEIKAEEIDGWVDVSLSIFTNYEHIKTEVDKLLLNMKNFDVRCSVDIYETIPKLNIALQNIESLDHFKDLVYDLDKKNHTIQKSVYQENSEVTFYFINEEEKEFFKTNLLKNISPLLKDKKQQITTFNDVEYISIIRKNNYLDNKKMQKY